MVVKLCSAVPTDLPQVGGEGETKAGLTGPGHPATLPVSVLLIEGWGGGPHKMCLAL